MRVQSSPPSSERKTPPLLLSRSSMLDCPPSSLCTTAYTIFGFLGNTAKPMRCVRDGSPLVSFFHVRPPSVLLKMPPRSLPSVASAPESNLHGLRRRAYNTAY